MQTMEIHVGGKVQGVFFRQRTRETASKLGLTGTVQNLPSGEVRIIATGERESLQQLIEWCHHGPPAARVDNVRVIETGFQSFETFSIRR